MDWLRQEDVGSNPVSTRRIYLRLNETISGTTATRPLTTHPLSSEPDLSGSLRSLYLTNLT